MKQEEAQMAGKTFYDSLMERQADSRKYKGKLILKKKDINWHVSPQGRNAAAVDAERISAGARRENLSTWS